MKFAQRRPNKDGITPGKLDQHDNRTFHENTRTEHSFLIRLISNSAHF